MYVYTKTKTKMVNYKLRIKSNSDDVAQYYENHSHFNDGDSGLDLFNPQDVIIKCGETKYIDLQITCEMKNNLNGRNCSYYLYPRSSISKTPLILKNSVGIIDAGYRGNIKAAVYYAPTHSDLKNINNDSMTLEYKINKGTRLFQICSPTLEPFSWELVDELSSTERGVGGFGSTGY